MRGREKKENQFRQGGEEGLSAKTQAEGAFTVPLTEPNDKYVYR